MKGQKLNVTDVIEAVRRIEAHKGKYVKSTLASLERTGTLDPKVRKIILDNFNDFARALCRDVGYTVED